MSLKERLKKIGPCLWELPKEAKQGMRVPSWLVLSDKLLNQVEDGAIEQIANVAFMPGIHKHSIALPDMHFGYGFPIGGVAALDFEKGGLSPGGIGFDINCTHPSTRVLCSQGYWRRIKDIERDLESCNLKFSDKETKDIGDCSLICFMNKEERNFLYEICTESGQKIKVTGDHPLMTDRGMVRSEELTKDDFLHMYPFVGVEYEEPSDDVIITRSDIEGILGDLKIFSEGNAKTQIMNKLEKLGLLEISYNSPKLPALLKIMGVVLGDGSISFVNRRKGFVGFYGSEKDLGNIKKDIISLGFYCPNIFNRKRNHKITTFYDTVMFSFDESSIVKKSTAFAVLLVALGIPYGCKTTKRYRIPKWLMKAPLWQKRLFLAAFFGAELSKPKTLNRYNFYEPQLNMNKLVTLKDNAIDFLNDVRLLLSEFGVTSSYPVTVGGYKYHGIKGESTGFRLKVHGNPNNLIKLFENIGYEYNGIKQRYACLAANYIRLKESVKKKRAEVRELALNLYNSGTPIETIRNKFTSDFTQAQFINHSVWTSFKNTPRIAFNFISFAEYVDRYSLGENGLVKADISSIRKIPYKGLVYDITVKNDSHDFIANNFVSSNCGVRLLRTNLTVEQIKPKVKELLESIFNNVPSGVGETGKIKLSFSELDDVLTNGARWAAEKGYGTEKDLEHLEEKGCMKGADPDKVSNEAKKRGAPQLGTLGAGNHFLEIQRVDKIYSPEIAKVFGIEKENQVCVLIHTGSRGFGHQVCTDYLRILESKFRNEINQLPDRELVYAPSGTRECEDYFSAMAAAANYAWTNRQMIMHWIRESFVKTLRMKLEDIGLEVVYDVAHNIGKIEEHEIDGKKVKVYIHRKGATRAFPAGNPEISNDYRKIGQPILLPGAMATASYVLVGDVRAKETFYSTAHGAGRVSSRTKMLKGVRGEDVARSMAQKGILSKAASWKVMAEEASEAYKDIDEVARVTEEAGISKRVVRLTPLGVIKG